VPQEASVEKLDEALERELEGRNARVAPECRAAPIREGARFDDSDLDRLT
jgi:hypothetical protein